MQTQLVSIFDHLPIVLGAFLPLILKRHGRSMPLTWSMIVPSLTHQTRNDSRHYSASVALSSLNAARIRGLASGVRGSCLRGTAEKCRAALEQLTGSQGRFRIDTGVADSIVAISPSCPQGRTKPEKALFYRPFLKAAGTAIRANLHALSLRIGPRIFHNEWFTSDACVHLKRGVDTKPGDSVLFTFVRNPIARFVSAYSELEHRLNTDPVLYVHDGGELLGHLGSYPVGSDRRAMRFAEYVLHGFDDMHVNSQAEALQGLLQRCSMNFDFIGKIEHFRLDWHRLARLIGCDASSFPFDRSLGRRKSSRDPFNTTRVMQSLLRRHPSLLRRLCAHYLPDFVAFDYALPPDCLQ